MGRAKPTSTPFSYEALESLSDGTWRPASTFLLALPNWAPVPDSFGVTERAATAGLRLAEAPPGEGEDGALFALEGEKFRVVALELSPEVGDAHLVAPDFLDADREAVAGSHHCLRVTLTLGEPVLEAFHEAMQRVAALAPDAVAIQDQEAMLWRPGSWLRDTAESAAPPSPESLYSIHAVVDDLERVWMHTHGLLRCGTIELEILNVAARCAGYMRPLLSATAQMMIEQGTPPATEMVVLGRDLLLAWRPWNEFLDLTNHRGIGDLTEREDHDFLVGTLVVETGKMRGLLRRRPKLLSLESLMPILRNDPILFISNMETRRMTVVASARFPSFRKIFKAEGHREDLDFHVKLGYTLDQEHQDEGSDSPQSEHMWFEVHAIDGGRIDATLLNQPQGIARMSCGDRDWHPVDQLSDWMIYLEGIPFRPDNLSQLLSDLGPASSD